MGDEADKGDKGDKSEMPNAQCPMPHTLIMCNKIGNLPTASIIEFDLLLNAHAD